jgi:hypothetical protein
MSIRIICINKDHGNHSNPHEAISRFGWIADGDTVTKHSNMAQMVEFVSNKANHAYVKNDGETAYCYVNVSAAGNKFIQTWADGDWRDNLLALPECKE